MTKEFVCCTHAYQNEKYNGKTLHNMKKDGSFRCSVCGKSHSSLVTKKTK